MSIDRTFAIAIALAAAAAVTSSLVAEEVPAIVTASSRYGETISTLDIRPIFGRGRRAEVRVELLSAISTVERYLRVAATDFAGTELEDLLVIVERPGPAVHELQWYEFDVANDAGSLSAETTYVDTLLQVPMADVQFLSVWGGNLDGDAEPDVVTLEQLTGDVTPRLWRREWTGSQLGAPSEIVVPLAPDRDVVAMDFGDLDGVGNLDLITIEREETGVTDQTFVNQYAFAGGEVTFERELFTAEHWIHNFVDVAIGPIDSDAVPDLVLVDSLLYDSTTQLQHWQVLPEALILNEFLLITIPAGEQLLSGNSLTTISINTCPVTGDYNCDGSVNAADYTVWRDSLGASGIVLAAGADGDGDGTITMLDYDVWKANFGMIAAGAGSSAGAVVPEPASRMLLLTIAGVLLISSAHRRNR